MRVYPSLLLLAVYLFVACEASSTTREAQSPPPSRQLDTLQLVQQQCARCHLLPSPTDLPATIWSEDILPRMGAFLGIYQGEYTRASLIEADAPQVMAQGIYPTQAVITPPEWEAIQAFYLGLAPDSLDCPVLPLAAPQQLFASRFPTQHAAPPGTLLTQFSPITGYFIGDVQQEALYYFNAQHERQAVISVPGGPIQLYTGQYARYVLSVGSFSPTDRAVGQLWQLPTQAGEAAHLLIDQLQRPVHFSPDPRHPSAPYPSFLISEYGKWTGRLVYWQADKSGQYTPTPLWERSGAIHAEWVDMDGDGQLEVIALFGQGQEGIWLFDRQVDGSFRAHPLLAFPPSYGSSSMHILDWNEDGLPDILYTNGDNADYTPIPKPYHGLRLFLNQGQRQFKEQLFLPLPGAYDCAAADYDLDGDLDLVSISFFPDFGRQAAQSLLFWEQASPGVFIPRPFAEATQGRWLRLASADGDGDGDQDLLVGAMAFEVVPDRGELKRWLTNGIGWLYFDNQTK